MAEETEDKKAEGEQDKRKDARRRDDSEPEKLDKILAGLDSVHKRLDAMDDDDKKRDDAMKAFGKRMDALDSRKRDDDDDDDDDKKRDDDDDDKKRDDDDDDKKRDDASENDERQAAELEKLAAEERSEKDKKRKDAKKRDDNETRYEGEDAPAPLPSHAAHDDDDDHPMHRRKDESRADHSKRVDAWAKKGKRDNLMCRDDESSRRHSARIDAMDPDEFEEEKKVESSNDKRRDARKRDDDDDKKRDDDDDDDKKRDDARADSVGAARLARLERETRQLRRLIDDRSDDDVAAFADAQARADSVFMAHGKQAKRPLAGEALIDYRVRLARELQPHSDKWRKADLRALARADSATSFALAEEAIYAEALLAAKNPSDVEDYTLREVPRPRPGAPGMTITEFFGSPLAWMDPMMLPRRRFVRINPRGGVN